LERPPLHQIDVEVAVAVVVDQRTAGAGDLGHVERAGAPVEVEEVEAELGGALDEDRWLAGPGAGLGRAEVGAAGRAGRSRLAIAGSAAADRQRESERRARSEHQRVAGVRSAREARPSSA